MTDAHALSAREHIRMADQGDIVDVLRTHHAHQSPFLSVSDEDHPAVDLRTEFIEGHVRLVPTVVRDYASVRGGSRIDDVLDPQSVSFHAW